MDAENPPIQKPNNAAYASEKSSFHCSFRWISKACFAFPFIKGAAFVYRQISVISLIDKLIRLTLEQSLDSDILEEVESALYDPVRESRTLRALLLYDLSFQQSIIVTGVLVLVISIVKPLQSALTQDYLNRMEVKRLQSIIYDRLFLSPHSSAIDVSQANDLIYSKLAAVDKYWADVKYNRVDDRTTILAALIFIMVAAWDLGLITFVGAGIIMAVSQYVLKQLSTPWKNNLDEKLEAVSARLSDLVACRDVVLTHTMEFQERDLLHDMLKSDRPEIKKLNKAKLISLVILLAGLVGLVPVLFIVVFVDEITLARVFQLMIIQILFYEMINALTRLFDYRHIVEQYNRAEETICEVLGMRREDVFPSGLLAKNLKSMMNDDYNDDNNTHLTNSTECSLRKKLVDISVGGQISFEKLSLGYQRKDASFDTIIEDMDLSLSLGNHYALMGESGAGKSTILKAMSGLIGPTSGLISVNDKPIETTQQYWREQVSVVSQDSILFNRTLRENLTYGLKEEVPDSVVFDALRNVNLEDKVRLLRNGLDTMIFENGNEFSGGQKQRLQIARLLMRNKPIVLLDEMTSALDAESTQRVIEVLKEYCAGRTLLMITHDITTLGLANTVLEIQRGGDIEYVCTKNCHETRDHWMHRFLIEDVRKSEK